MTYQLGQQSRARLSKVHPDLQRVVERAIQITSVDFTVFEGLRTLVRQREFVASGVSRSLDSRHLTGHAVDLVPLLGGVPRWDWPLCYQVADAVKRASAELSIPLEWGGVWDRTLGALSDDLEREVAAYVIRYKKANPGEKAFTDGPHFQLPRKEYP